jgi:hypothetical protein
MKLVEADAVGPVEGDDALVTPPRPPHRRVSVSLLLTLSVLIGTVVTIYTVFPARHQVLVTEAVGAYRGTDTTWDLTEPTDAELRAWAIGVTGPGVVLPGKDVHVRGARRVEVLHRGAALLGLTIGSDSVLYIVQHARGIAPDRGELDDGDLRAVAWRDGKFSCVAVGPAAHAATWIPALRGAR